MFLEMRVPHSCAFSLGQGWEATNPNQPITSNHYSYFPITSIGTVIVLGGRHWLRLQAW